ncbi:YdcF family protein [Paenibacillus xanthanilyticus]|uniref:YdcF family protein n=1 Tax=Paenibacillus xanthanilyticus TaxID=1783531 RepID=A0ABV8K317_9BACL
MLFAIKLLYGFLLPPGLFILILFFFCFWLYKRNMRFSIYLSIVTLLLYISLTPLAGELLIKPLEHRYVTPTNIKGDVIILLGGGVTLDTRDIDGVGHPMPSTANRILTTARVYMKTQLPVILSSGQLYQDVGNEAIVDKRLLMSLGVPGDKIILEAQSLSTTENAEFTGQLLKNHKFKQPILVTSAYHMPRAIMNFTEIGVSVLPIPTDYLTSRKNSLHVNKFSPTSNLSYIALKEYLGMLYLKILN